MTLYEGSEQLVEALRAEARVFGIYNTRRRAWTELSRLHTLVERDPMATHETTPIPERYAHAGPFMTRAMEEVYSFVKDNLDKTDTVEFDITMVYVVWFSKTLGNWKALISTALPDGKYYEVTYDGANDCIYLDAYVKFQNIRIEFGTKNSVREKYDTPTHIEEKRA